jgi:hypothetical protein
MCGKEQNKKNNKAEIQKGLPQSGGPIGKQSSEIVLDEIPDARNHSHVSREIKGQKISTGKCRSKKA